MQGRTDSPVLVSLSESAPERDALGEALDLGIGAEPSRQDNEAVVSTAQPSAGALVRWRGETTTGLEWAA